MKLSLPWWTSRRARPRRRPRLALEALETREVPATWIAPDLLTQSDTGPVSLDNVTQETRPLFAGMTTSPAGTHVTLMIDGVPQGLYVVPLSGGTIFSIQAAQPLSEGAHTVRFFDARTQASSAPLSVRIDTSSPVLGDLTPPAEIVTPDGDGVNDHLLLSFSLSEPAAATVILVDAEGEDIGVRPLGILAAGTHVADVDVIGFGTGIYSFRVEATDLAGNPAEALSGTFAVELILPPVADLNDPPTLILPVNLQTFRNQDLAFVGAHAIVVADVDATHMRFVLAVDVGSLELTSSVGLTFALGSGSTQLVLDGPLDVLNACLEGLIYRPQPGYLGPVYISLTANDLGGTGDGGPQVAIDTLSFEIVNRPPTVSAGPSYSMSASTVLTVAGPSLLSAFRDADGDALQLRLASLPPVGTLDLRPDGSFTYTPALGYVGRVTFSVRAFDGVDLSSALTVTIDVKSLFSLRR